MSASFLLRCTGVTCYTPRCLALGACKRDELATLHGLSPSKVPTSRSPSAQREAQMLVRLSIIGAFAAILMLPTTLSAQINPGGAINPGGGINPGGAFNPGGGLNPGGGINPGAGYPPGGRFPPGAVFPPRAGCPPRRRLPPRAPSHPRGRPPAAPPAP